MTRILLTLFLLLSGPSDPGSEEIQKEPLALDLELEKTQFIRGESIAFTLTLRNGAATPLAVADASPANRAFCVRIAGPGGFAAEGDTSSILAREGENVDQPRNVTRKVLGPGDSLAVKGDLLSWIGELAPGTYTLQGKYDAAPMPQITAMPRTISIGEASIVYARQACTDIALAGQPRESVWINRGSAAHELYLLRSSPNAPAVAYCSRLIARLQDAAPAAAATYEAATQAVRHVVWPAPGNALAVVRLDGEASSGEPRLIPLPGGNLQVLESAHTGRDGRLFVILRSTDGASAALIQVPDRDMQRAAPIAGGLPLRPPLHALWRRDNTLVLAWTGASGTDLYAAVVPLDPLPTAIAGRQILGGNHPIENIALAQRYRRDSRSYDSLAIVLMRDRLRNEFLRKRVDLAGGKVESEERFAAKAGTMGRVLESCLGADLNPRYLFEAPDGSVYFVNSAFSGSVQIVTAGKTPVRRSDFPAILIASSFSRLPGAWVRFVETGRRFAYMKVE